MSEFSRLLDDVMDDNSVSDKQLAFACGKDRSMISRYRHGEYSCVWELLPHLWNLTKDRRLIEFIVQGKVIAIEKPKPANGKDAIVEMIAARRKHLDFEVMILDMLADGVIDDHDDIKKFIRLSNESMAASLRLTETIKAEYKRNTGKKI